MTHYRETLDTPVREAYEVIVAGGGVAGAAAALAAARAGRRVLLLEKSAMLGGLATLGLISWYEPLCDGQGLQLMYGMAEEFLRLSIQYGHDSLPERWRKPGDPPGLGDPSRRNGRYSTHFSPTLFALALEALLLKEGVTLRLDILAASPRVEAGRVTGVIAESKSGRELFPSQVVVDATGDADLLYRAGVPCVEGQNFLSVVAHYADQAGMEAGAGQRNTLRLRRWINPASDMRGKGHPEGFPRYAGVRNEEVTDFLLAGHRMLLDRVAREDRFARDILTLPGMAQFRTTRRLDGGHVLTAADARTRQADSVGLAADFVHPGEWYEIPWPCLYHPSVGNLLTAGRTVSAAEHGWEVARVIPVAVLTGQAAGTAAAEMVRLDLSAQALPVDALQQGMERQGVRLHHD